MRLTIPPIVAKPLALAGRRAHAEAASARLLRQSGLVAPLPPRIVAKMGSEIARFGMFGGVVGASAHRFGDRAAIADELGSMSFRELLDAANAVANTWHDKGLRSGDTVAILSRNHRWFMVALFAAARSGVKVVLLNSEFAGPQLREVAEREGTDLLVHDEEYDALVGELSPTYGTYLGWTDSPHDNSLAAVAATGSTATPVKPSKEAKIILLTSGTTGTPKGAPRKEPKSLTLLGALLSRVPLHVDGTIEIPAPMFHTLGFAHAMAAVTFGCTMVIRRRFDPAIVLGSLGEHGATGLVVVPVMLQRLVDLPDEAWATADVSKLKFIFVAGSQLGADLATRATEKFGPVVHNMYGSTEVAYATVATPEDLAAEPGCVGKPVLSSVVKVVDDAGKELPAGEVGRIFVGNLSTFDGYTGGGHKEILDGMLATGDVGHFDAAGRLFVDGRDDDMIVSGGENVFPGEIEELLAAHPAVLEVAVIGVEDPKFGQRLNAYVVRRPDHDLTEADVKEHVTANLARFKSPREVKFLDELPRNPTGKVLKRELK